MSSVINSGLLITAPSAPVAATGTSGNLSAGNYSYRLTFLTAFGETEVSAASNVIAPGAGGSATVTIAAVTDGNVTGRNLYRTDAGGSTFKLVNSTPIANINPSTGAAITSYSDTLADLSLGANAPSVNTSGSLQQVRGWVAFQRPAMYSVTNAITAFAGGGQASATPLVSEYNYISTVATAADSCVLPTVRAALIGLRVVVNNKGANSANIFPAVGQSVNALSANTAFAVAANASATFVAVSATAWQTSA